MSSNLTVHSFHLLRIAHSVTYSYIHTQLEGKQGEEEPNISFCGLTG